MTCSAVTSTNPMPIDDDGTLWARARALMPAAASGGLTAALAGRHLCVLADDPDTPDARLFDAAAAALGARVTHLSPARAGLGEGPGISGTGALLARLYDAIECQGLPRDRVQGLAGSTTIPVFSSMAAHARACSSRAGTPGASSDALVLLQAGLVAAFR